MRQEGIKVEGVDGVRVEGNVIHEPKRTFTNKVARLFACSSDYFYRSWTLVIVLLGFLSYFLPWESGLTAGSMEAWIAFMAAHIADRVDR